MMSMYADPNDPRCKASKRKHYEENKAQYYRRNQEAKARKVEWLRTQKNVPCKDCKKRYPYYVMDFDHRDGVVKIRSISWMALHDTSNFEKIKQEIEKCDLVCANCHRQRTHDKLVKIATVAKMVKAGV